MPKLCSKRSGEGFTICKEDSNEKQIHLSDTGHADAADRFSDRL